MIFKSKNEKVKAILKNKTQELYPNCKNGETYLIGPTKLNKGTHCYFYSLKGEFRGCFPLNWFKIMDELEREEENSAETKTIEYGFEQLAFDLAK